MFAHFIIAWPTGILWLLLHTQLLVTGLFAWPVSHTSRDVFSPRLEIDANATERHSRLGSSKKTFDLTITWEDYAPDGFARKMLLVNGQSPGPLLEIDQGDWVAVTVHNQAPFNTTIHYHRIEMVDAPWSDGVPGVTQRAITSGSNFTCEFRATQYGSYWYHSHFHGQIEDGLHGPMLIHPGKGTLKPFHLISSNIQVERRLEEAEKGIKPLLVSDFTHLTSDEKWEMTQRAGLEISCYDSVLFNGKGSVQCQNMHDLETHLNQVQRDYLATVRGASITDKGCFPASALIKFGSGSGDESALPPGTFSGCESTTGSVETIKTREPVDPHGDWIAIDIIGGFNFITAVISIEHDMWVYAMDGSYVEPQKVQAITVSNGDRYSVFVNTKKTGNFMIRSSSVNIAQVLVGRAILSVGGGNSTDVSDPFIDITGNPTSPDVAFFNQAVAHPYPPEPVAAKADAFSPLNMKVDGASYLWAMNSTRLMPTDVAGLEPTLFSPALYLQNNVTITTKLNTWVDLLFFTGSEPMPPHPIHEHGNKMFQIGSGVGHFRWN
ncbi:Cupredoxin [Fusarium oxysporum f. sp. albedinis]|nr:Cupredoxin [Fusarium oxysporum f. sp. albedinis]